MGRSHASAVIITTTPGMMVVNSAAHFLLNLDGQGINQVVYNLPKLYIHCQILPM